LNELSVSACLFVLASFLVILHRHAKFLPNRTTAGEVMTSCRFFKWRYRIRNLFLL